MLATTVVNGLTITLRQLPDYPGAAAGEAYSINSAGDMGSAVIAPTWNERPLPWPQGRHDRSVQRAARHGEVAASLPSAPSRNARRAVRPGGANGATLVLELDTIRLGDWSPARPSRSVD